MTLRRPRSASTLLVFGAVIGALLFGRAEAASADTLFAATGARGAASTLYTLDPGTGAATPVGAITVDSTQVEQITGLAIDPTDGQLYGFMNSGTQFDPPFGQGTLLSIDKTTGEAEEIGGPGDAGIQASDMTFDRFGNLYAWTSGCDGDTCNANGSDLYELDLTNGTSTRVSDCGCIGFGTGLASDSMGRMYLKSFEAFFHVNQFTGHVFAPLPLDDFNTDNVLSFGPADVLYTGDRAGTGFQLKTLNPATGGVTGVGVPNGVQGISAIEWDLTTPTAPAQSDLSLDKSVDDPAPAVNDTVVFTITVSVDGGDDATDVQVRDLLPSGFTYVSDDSGGSYDDETGIWDVGTVELGTPQSLQITATVNAAGVHTNSAEVIETTTYDPDSVPGSEEGDTFDSVRSSPAGSTALFAATGAGVAFCGGNPSALYELDPDTAAATKVGDIMINDAGIAQAYHVTGLAFDPTDGMLYGFMNFQESDCDDAQGGPGTLVTIDKDTGSAAIVGSVGATGIQSPDMTFDPSGDLFALSREDGDLYKLDKGDGSAERVGECVCSVSRVGLAADSIGRMWLKRNDVQLVRIDQFNGHAFGSTVTVDEPTHNMLAFGPGDTLFSGLRDPFPDRFRDPETFRLKTIDLSAADATTVGSNAVQKISALAWDLGVTTIDFADLSLVKSATNPNPNNWFEVVEFTITVTNHGPDESTGVVVRDVIPSGFIFQPPAVGDGSYDDSTGIWTVGTLEVDESASIELTTRVAPTGDRTNVAEVVESTTYDPDSALGSNLSDAVSTVTITPNPLLNPAIDVAANVIVNGPSRATNTKKGFSVQLTNVGTQSIGVDQSHLEADLNGNSGAVTCKPFSKTLRPGRSTKVHCSANIASLGLAPDQPVTYNATIDVPPDGFTHNDSDSEARTTS